MLVGAAGFMPPGHLCRKERKGDSLSSNCLATVVTGLRRLQVHSYLHRSDTLRPSICSLPRTRATHSFAKAALSPPTRSKWVRLLASLCLFPLALTASKSSWDTSLVSVAGLKRRRCFPSCLCLTSFHSGIASASARLNSKHWPDAPL